MNSVPPPTANPVWERTIVTEERPGGYRVPILGADMKPIRVKEYYGNKKKIDARLRQIKNPT
jgi:hypothetical protein